MKKFIHKLFSLSVILFLLLSVFSTSYAGHTAYIVPDPQGGFSQHSVKFDFDAANNPAENGCTHGFSATVSQYFQNQANSDGFKLLFQYSELIKKEEAGEDITEELGKFLNAYSINYSQAPNNPNLTVNFQGIAKHISPSIKNVRSPSFQEANIPLHLLLHPSCEKMITHLEGSTSDQVEGFRLFLGAFKLNKTPLDGLLANWIDSTRPILDGSEVQLEKLSQEQQYLLISTLFKYLNGEQLQPDNSDFMESSMRQSQMMEASQNAIDREIMELQYELEGIQRGMDEKLYHISMQHKEEKQRLSEQYRQKKQEITQQSKYDQQRIFEKMAQISREKGARVSELEMEAAQKEQEKLERQAKRDAKKQQLQAMEKQAAELKAKLNQQDDSDY